MVSSFSVELVLMEEVLKLVSSQGPLDFVSKLYYVLRNYVVLTSTSGRENKRNNLFVLGVSLIVLLVFLFNVPQVSKLSFYIKQ